MQSKKVPSSVSRDFNIDDYIGMESCTDLKTHHKAADMSLPKSFSTEVNGNSKMWGTMGRKYEKEYPPPIPLLIRTENLASHMPWVMKRQYTADGRLILTEEKISHREFFRAHRSDGRLMLQLVAVVEDQVAEDRNVEMRDEVGGGATCRAACRGQRCNVYVGSGNAGGSLRTVTG